MTNLTCQVCGQDAFIVTPRELADGKADGRYVTGSRLKTYRDASKGGEQFTTTETVVFYVCKDCKREAAKEAVAWQAHPEEARHRRIMGRLTHVRRNNPEMPLDEVAMRATEDEFEPIDEPNAEFRRYLIERQERGRYSTEQDAIARDILENLPNE